jgi:hypothetical protein
MRQWTTFYGEPMEPTSFAMRLGDVAIVELSDLPSAGYLWSADAMPDFIELLGKETLADTKGAALGRGVSMGGQSPIVFLIRAKKIGQGVARFRLARPWNPLDHAEEFEVLITALAAPEEPKDLGPAP